MLSFHVLNLYLARSREKRGGRVTIPSNFRAGLEYDEDMGDDDFQQEGAGKKSTYDKKTGEAVEQDTTARPENKPEVPTN